MKWDDDRGRPVIVSERLSMDPTHVRQGRLKKGLPFLDDHNKYGGYRSVLGLVENGFVRADGVGGTVRFGANASDELLRDIETKILNEFSGGYRVYTYQITKREEGPDDYLAIDWEPLEASVTPIGADEDAGQRSMIQVRSMEEREMPEPTKPADPAPDIAAQVRAEINLIVKRGNAMDVSSTVIEDVLARGLTLDASTEEFIAVQKRAKAPKAPEPAAIPNGQTRTLSAGKDQKEKDAEAIIEYLSYRGLPQLYPLTEGAKRFIGRSMVDICRHICESHGWSTEGKNKEEVVERAMLGFGKRDVGGLHTTSDFPNLLGDGVISRTLQKAYDAVPDDYSEIVSETTFSDPRTREFIGLGSFGELRQVGEAQEYKRVSLEEEAEELNVFKYGEIFGLSLEALLKDDLSAFTRLPRAFANSVKLTEAAIVFGLLVNNPVLSDGKTVFHNDHGNIGTAAAPDTTGLTDARTLMRKQAPIGRTDTRLGIKPYRVISPYKYETGLLQLMKDASVVRPTVPEDIVPGWIRDMGYIISDVVDIASTQAWYAVANPAVVESIVVARLEGAGPFKVFQKEGWNVDGIEYKVRAWFGAGIVNHRGLYRNPGV